MELDKRIENLLLGLGIPKHIKGFVFLREALKRCMQDNIAADKKLYSYVSQKLFTTAECVNREIKHAIEVAYERYDTPLHRQIFVGHFAPKSDEFINSLLRELRK